jgi:RHS repeat-associated protein
MNYSFKHIIIFLWSLARKHSNTPIDALTFGYTGNMLHQVADGENNSLGFSGTGTYTYDMAGRMTGDSQKGTIAYNHLSLVKTVTKGTDVLKYTYDATCRRIKKQLNNATPRWYMDGVERSGDTTMIHTEYGRIRRNATADPWKWDYFLKDHLGNVRVVLEAPSSSAQSNTILYMATMEESKAATEDTYFANLDETRADRPYNYPDKNLLNAKLANVPGKSKGPSILLPVLAGDTVSISAKAFYNMDKTLPGQGVDVAPVLGSAIAAMTSPAGTVLGETALLAIDLGAEASQSVALVNVPKIVDKTGEVKPQSGINFILYNSRMEVVEENTGVLLVEDRINEIQTLASDHLVMQEAGFLEVYINNQAQTPVYYDNFAVMATTSNVVEINAYYPYGMLLPALSLMATPDKWNGYKYSGKELQKEMELNWGDHENRMADYTIGRWWVPDPLAEKRPWESTYSFCGNNPVNRIDPDGRKWKTTLDEEIAKQLQNAAQEQLKQTNKEISRLEKRIDKLEAKGKDVSNLQGNLNTAKYEASLLDNFNKGIEGIRLDETTNYTFTTVDRPVAELNSRIDGTIVIENVGIFENRVHETVHAIQYFNKEVTLKTPGGRNFIYPSKEAIELPAYRTQFLMEKPKAVPAGTPAIPRGHSLYGHPKSLLEINSQWLKRIPNPTTGGRL